MEPLEIAEIILSTVIVIRTLLLGYISCKRTGKCRCDTRNPLRKQLSGRIASTECLESDTHLDSNNQWKLPFKGHERDTPYRETRIIKPSAAIAPIFSDSSYSSNEFRQHLDETPQERRYSITGRSDSISEKIPSSSRLHKRRSASIVSFDDKSFPCNRTDDVFEDHVAVEPDRLLTVPNKKEVKLKYSSHSSSLGSSHFVEHVQHAKHELCPQILNSQNQQTVQKGLHDSYEEQLDWENIFRFLSKLIGSDWRYFITCLYGNSMNIPDRIESRISQIEHTTKSKNGGNNTHYIIIDQLRAWREWEGPDANCKTIIQTFEELERNKDLHDFKDFMRNPPLRRVSSQICIQPMPSQYRQPVSYLTLNSTNSSYQEPFRSQTSLKREELHYSLERKLGGKEQTESTFNIERMRNSHKAITSFPETETCKKETHYSEHHKKSKLDSRPNYLESCKPKQKDNTFIRKHKRLCLRNDTFLILAKTFIEAKAKTTIIPRDMYDMLLRISVEELVEEAGLSKNKVLAMTFKEFKEMHRADTQREVLFVFYVGNERAVISQCVYENMELYVKARERILTKVNKETTVIDYVFVTYDGFPKVEQTEEKQTESELRKSGLFSDDPDGSSNDEDSSIDERRQLIDT